MPESTSTAAASTEFGPRKTVVILALVAGCFAVLLPKIFYPMLTASLTPSAVHHVGGSGCCDVIFESDVTAVDIMQELCLNIIRHHQVDPRIRDALGVSKFNNNNNNNNKLTPSSASLCREEVLAKCGIDLSSFLAEKERLKKSYKQVLEEIRGFNGSLCLKMQFGVPLARLGTPHLIRYHILMPHSPIRQERQTPPHAGSYHPALRERGSAIPSSHIVPKIQDRPDHAAPPIKMRPPMGGGGTGHVVAAPKGNGFVGLLMPLYTIGIVIFFLYTLTKVLVGIFMPIYTIGNMVSLLYKVLQVLRKSSDNEIIMRPEYSTADAEKEYQKMVFNPEIFAAAVNAVNGTQHEQNIHSTAEDEKAPSIQELKEHEPPKSNGLAAGINSKDPNSEDQRDKEFEEEMSNEASPTIKVVNMEMTATCEGGQRYSRPTTPTLLAPHSHQEEKEKSPPISIYLEGSLPSQCELLVTDSKTQELLEEETMEVPVVLSGKMTLSLISLDQDSQDDTTTPPQYNSPIHDIRSSSFIHESRAEAKSNNKIQVLQQEDSDEEEDETEEEESVSEEDDEFPLQSNRELPYDNQNDKDQESFKQEIVRKSSDEEISDHALHQNNEIQSEEDKEESEDGDEEDEEDEEDEGEEDEEDEDDQEDDGDEYEDDQEDDGDEYEEENRKWQLKKPLGEKKTN